MSTAETRRIKRFARDLFVDGEQQMPDDPWAAVSEYVTRLITTEDYRYAWYAEDRGGFWIAYGHDWDYLIPRHPTLARLILSAVDVRAFEDYSHESEDRPSETESRLALFITACQLPRLELRPGDQSPEVAETFVMLYHEPHLLQDEEAGPAWRRLKNENITLYAAVAFALHRQEWTKDGVNEASASLLALDRLGVNVGNLPVLSRIDPLRIERALERKDASGHVPSWILRKLKPLRELTAPPVISGHEQALSRALADYERFLEEYRRRRHQRFDGIADNDLKTAAGAPPQDPRGTPRKERQLTLTVNAISAAMADELVDDHQLSRRKANILAERFTRVLFHHVPGISKRPV